MARSKTLKTSPAKPKTRKPRTVITKAPEITKRRSFYAVVLARYLQMVRGGK